MYQLRRQFGRKQFGMVTMGYRLKKPLRYANFLLMSWLSSAIWLSCSNCPMYSGCPAQSILSCQSCPRCPVLAVLFWLSCSGCPVLAVLSWLSWLFRPGFLSSLSYPGCSFLAVLSDSPVLAWLVLPVGPVLVVLFWQSCPAILSRLSCPCCCGYSIIFLAEIVTPTNDFSM
jgi:hypothetical protein